MPGRIEEVARAKINLFLHAGARRADGYHDLQSLAVFADAGDGLSFDDASALSLSIDGPFAEALAHEPDNLVLRAADALAAEANRAALAQIRLTKNLPVASGLGGGSADAAAALRGLSELWNARLPNERLYGIAAALGSDVPVCIASISAWMEGRGERALPLPVPSLHMVLVNPGVAVATKKVFARLEGRSGTALAAPNGFRDLPALLEFLGTTRNDLEAPAIAMAPAISEALISLSAGVSLLARMSGSGATCFGLFDSASTAKMAATSIANTHDAWWVTACRTQ